MKQISFLVPRLCLGTSSNNTLEYKVIILYNKSKEKKMPQVYIPDTLFKEIEKTLPKASSADEFVLQAVREKLTFAEHKQEFLRISDRAQAAMSEKGISETDVLADFDHFRKKLNG
jgi:hypothetical protein